MNNQKKVPLKIGKLWSFNNKVSKVFDQHVRESIPLYENFHDQACKIAEFYCKENSIIYDLGCSTGNFVLKISKIKNNLEIIGIDESKNMIEISKLKNKKIKKNKVNFICSDIFDVNLKKSDLIMCSLLLPFMKINKQKKLIQKIYKSLNHKGAAIILNKSLCNYANFENIFNQLYYDFKLKQGISHDDVIKKAKSLRSIHTLNTLDEDCKMFKKIGFSKIEIFFKHLNFTGFLLEK